MQTYQDPTPITPGDTTLPPTLAEQGAPAEVGTSFRDSMQAIAEIPSAAPQGIERIALAEDKLPVVLAVVLVIWFGILLLLFRTERRLARVERALPERVDDV